ncbi:MAG: exodeoxyribonuclease VII small subunit [Pseudomonadota bacterium]
MTDTGNEDGTRNTEAPDFETSLEQLESLVQAMEDGDLSLEQSLEAFEKGIRLTRECQKALQEAEQKVQYLLGEEDTPRDDEQ